ncbi:MAG TPA: aldehyde dehydrogenase family protein [Dermatophilaceae bacterium]|nr:aldehyde dehydrogenase family protein [Dermatophilaceae bacterium]
MHAETTSQQPGVAETVTQLRDAFRAGVTKPYEWRADQLKAMRRMLLDNESVLAAALRDDLGKGSTESYLTEIGFLVNEIDHTLKHLRRWLRPSSVGVPAWMLPARARLVREPLGVVLVISPWNYPLLLSLSPVIGAIAAGNAVVLTPSEVAPATSGALAHLMPVYLDPAAVRVVEGGVEETTALLEQRFDHIFYTGNAVVGRIIMQAAAVNLTPVTLELGGKSPTFVDEGADLAVTARRIVWGKFTNAGQTCVAPDYVLGTPPVLEALKPLLEKAIREFHGEQHPVSVDTYGRIVNDRHFARLDALIDDDLIFTGGRRDASARYIEPTVLHGVSGEHAVMQEEIFGPILPLIEVADLDAAIDFINDREKPLALYVFTNRAETKRRFVRDTSSGGLTFNVPLAHLGVPGLPFGGVGQSGMGKYHGEASIDVFSHTKAVLDKPTTPDTLSLIYPPFTGLKESVIRRLVTSGGRR